MTENEDHLERQAEEVGCWGLVGGIAKSLRTNHECYASSATKDDGPFYCPDCFSDSVAVALRREPASEAGAARRVCPRCNFLIESGATSPI